MIFLLQKSQSARGPVESKDAKLCIEGYYNSAAILFHSIRLLVRGFWVNGSGMKGKSSGYGHELYADIFFLNFPFIVIS